MIIYNPIGHCIRTVKNGTRLHVRISGWVFTSDQLQNYLKTTNTFERVVYIIEVNLYVQVQERF